jgi:serine/threonine protein kinase
MNKYKAQELEKEIKGIELNGFEIIDLINNGKSAAVFRAQKNCNFFAFKVFDNELIERFGHEIQTKRIEQEIALKGHKIDGLVEIFDGGKASFGGQDYYYLVMEYIEGKNLTQFIQTESYDLEFTFKVLSSLITTTEQLLNQKQIAHRDIKPENIMVRDDGKIILMDLGVLKLIGAKSFSDEEEKSFVGTLRYAAPEFLMREEEDSVNGWRALNLYQIGATLHDLVVKKELFWDKTPYSNLVIAIKDDLPPIDNKNYPFYFQQLIRDMLSKNWSKRLELLPPDRIQEVLNPSSKSDSLNKSIDDVLKKRMGHQAKFDELEKLRRTNEEIRNKQKEVAGKINNAVEQSFIFLKDKGVYISYKKSNNFNFARDRKNDNLIIQNYLYELEGDLKLGFIRNLSVLVHISNDDLNYSEISIWGIFPSAFHNVKVEHPIGLFQALFEDRPRQIALNTPRANSFNQPPVPFDFTTVNIFKGVIDFGDSFNEFLTIGILGLISKALDIVQDAVTKKLEYYEALAKRKGNNGFIEGSHTDHTGDIIIDKI